MSQAYQLARAAHGLAHHPQDHGWRTLYKLFSYGLDNSAPNLTGILLNAYELRPSSATHLITLLGIAIKAQSIDELHSMIGKGTEAERLNKLEHFLGINLSAISDIMHTRQNSFTCARRFLLPQVLLSAIFSADDDLDAHFADFGTGLGILPRQLNSQTQFEKFAPGLKWPGLTPAYKPIRIAQSFGTDRGPLPDPLWVNSCYGSSEYYCTLHQELQAVLNDQSVRAADVVYSELDLLDYEATKSFIQEHRINAANMCYVLYELDSSIRGKVIHTVSEALRPPGILLVTEPQEELHQQGCVVELYRTRSPRPERLLAVSDGHFKGNVMPLENYSSFIAEYSIASD